MTSRHSATRSSRRFAWLAVGIIVAIALYTAGWFYVAELMTRRAEAGLAAVNGNGNRAVCERMEARGYPFRIGLYCSATFLENRREGLAVSTGELRSAAQIYNPFRLIAELDGPARIMLPGLQPLDVSWATMRSSLRLAMPLPNRVSVEATELDARADTLAADGVAAMAAERVELHMRPTPNGTDVDLAARFEELTLGPAMLSEGAIPAVSGTADIAWLGAAVMPPRGLRGATFDIRSVALRAGNGAALSARGSLAIGEDGLADGEIELTADDAAALSAFLVGAFPAFADQIGTAMSGLSLLGPRPSLPLRIVNGEMTLGFLPLGSLPPL